MILRPKDVAWGVVEPLPLRGFPAGKVRLRLRNNEFVRVRVRTADGVREPQNRRVEIVLN